jgi:DNA-binding response OmpR family regulator
LLRRQERAAAGEAVSVLRVGKLEVDEERFEVRVAGVAVAFTPTEFHILQVLASKPGRVFRRAELLGQVDGGSFAEERTVDAHVRSIRQKLGANAELVQTVRGRGYRVMDEGS